MKTIIVLAMHGVPPKGFPEMEIAEMFRLHMQLEHMPIDETNPILKRHRELDSKVRNWTRTPENDPYWAASNEIARLLVEKTNSRVVVGFNEFCAPSILEAIDQAASESPDRIVVVTPMMTRGGEHSEVDIPEAIDQAKEKHNSIEIVYAWPFDSSAVVELLSNQIDSHLQ
ncbi:MAG: sirohydrochlorin chelatase [Candidatus Thorarchaeota archaeon]|jgi:sirohydrochlorin cobaltochelatase